MRIKKTYYCIALLTIIGCAAGKSTTTGVSDLELANARKRFPDATISDIETGKLKFTDNCGRCHSLKNPPDVSEERWNSVLPKMFVKAKMTDSLSQQQVREYVFSKMN